MFRVGNPYANSTQNHHDNAEGQETLVIICVE